MKLPMKTASSLFATGCGLGYSPILPGTTGTLGAVFGWYLLFSIFPTPLSSIILLLAITALGYWSINGYLDEKGLGESDDPSEVVIDEWAGVLIPLTVVSTDSPWEILFAFLLFRLFDISKVWPVCWFERFPRAHGIMLDDLVAGLLALVSLLLIRTGLA